MDVSRKHKKELNSIDPYRILQNKMRTLVPPGSYWGASLGVRSEETQFFTRGNPDTASSDTAMGLKFWYVDDYSLYFGGNELKETLGHLQDIEIALQRACDNIIRTNIILPKEFVYATRNSPSLELTLGDWVNNIDIDETDLANELKCASNIKSEDVLIRPITSHELLRRRLYFTNSEGVEVESEENNYRATCKLELLDERTFKRRIGCSFKDERDMQKLKSMIKHTKDITPNQHLKKSKDFVELTNNLFELCMTSQLPHKQKKVRSTSYTVITPFEGFIHEAIGHPCEERFYFERQNVDDSKWYLAPLYPKTHQSFPEFITFADDPLIRISNLSLYGAKRYDDEGFKTAKKTLLQNGRITGERLGSSFSIGKGYGNAHATDLDGLPMPRMTVSTLDHNPTGPKDMNELIELAKSLSNNPIILCIDYPGYVTELGDFMLGNETNPDSAETYIYNPKQEEFLSIVNPIVLKGNVYNALKNCITANKFSMSIDAGFCGVDNPVKYGSNYNRTSQVAPLGILQNIDVVPLITKDQIKGLKTD